MNNDPLKTSDFFKPSCDSLFVIKIGSKAANPPHLYSFCSTYVNPRYLKKDTFAHFLSSTTSNAIVANLSTGCTDLPKILNSWLQNLIANATTGTPKLHTL